MLRYADRAVRSLLSKAKLGAPRSAAPSVAEYHSCATFLNRQTPIAMVMRSEEILRKAELFETIRSIRREMVTLVRLLQESKDNPALDYVLEADDLLAMAEDALEGKEGTRPPRRGGLVRIYLLSMKLPSRLSLIHI